MPMSTNWKVSLGALRSDFSRGATYAKTIVTAVVTGAAADVAQLMASGDHEALLFSQAGLLKLKHTFLYGAACSIIGLFRSSPLHATVGVPVNVNAEPPVSPVNRP